MKLLSLLIFIFWAPFASAIPNPASVHCVQHGGKLFILDQGGQVGFCLFRDLSYCEEWHYFRGTCHPETYFLPEKRKGTTYCFTEEGKENLIIYLCKAKK